MRLTVLSVAYPFAPVGPAAVGGAERILSDLDRALVAAGHVSLVAACEGSHPAGRLFSAPLPQLESLDEAGRRRSKAQFQSAIDLALSAHRVDVIHMHGLNFHEYVWPPGIPALVTLHLPLAWYPPDIWKSRPGRVLFQFVSETQRQSAPPEMRHSPVATNGVALPPLSNAPRGDFALAMGRICPEKNQHAALQAGSLAGVRVLVAGMVFPYPEHKKYFSEKLAPLLGTGPGDGHEFLGALSPDRLWELLARARCLLHPTLAPETSSLIAMEALAAGTPVIAYPSGALPEIVDEGVTGYLVHDVKEMAQAIPKASAIPPEVCRETAARRFSAERMVREYFGLYRRLLESAPRGAYAHF